MRIKQTQKRKPAKRMTAEERRQSLIEATIKVVAKYNYDRATTARIARAAGVNEALIYSHFKSKKLLQLATLDYLVAYRMKIYSENPVFQAANRNQSVMRALNAQYLERILSPDIDMFNCILKAMYAIDPEIREKGFQCALTLKEFTRINLIEDSRRGFFNDTFDPDIVAWEILGRIMVISTLAINGNLDAYGLENMKKSARYFESIYLRNLPEQP